jgi:hypothetical protein
VQGVTKLLQKYGAKIFNLEVINLNLYFDLVVKTVNENSLQFLIELMKNLTLAVN